MKAFDSCGRKNHCFKNKFLKNMKKLIKKILTSRKMRNAAAMSAFVATVANVGNPWAPL